MYELQTNFTRITGVYGDVLRVKIMYNKRDTALVQYTSPEQVVYSVYSVLCVLCVGLMEGDT